MNSLQKWILKGTLHSLTKLFILLTLPFLLITSCHRSILQESNVPLVTSECRVVQHKLGNICIPVNPKRIVTLEPRYLTDPLLTLGIQPIGTAIPTSQGGEYFAGLTSKDLEGIEKVGDPYQPSLEKILQLNPDLILGMDFAHEKIYKQLSTIAPTLIVDYKKKNYSFKNNLQYLAQILDRESEAGKILSQYQGRIEKLRNQLGRKPKEIEVTVLIYYAESFVITSSYHTSHEIFSDIGLINKISGHPGGTGVISLETLNQYDADILFVMNYGEKPKSFFLENPLISSLNAVKNNRFYFVNPEIWEGNGPLGVNRILDDLFKYLPEGA